MTMFSKLAGLSIDAKAPTMELTEWPTNVTGANGMRVLDLGCRLDASSIYLHREFGVQVGHRSVVQCRRTAREFGMRESKRVSSRCMLTPSLNASQEVPLSETLYADKITQAFKRGGYRCKSR